MNPFEYIRERITEIADTLAAVDGRYPSWDYADITQLLDNIEKNYNAKYGSSDTVYRSDAIEALKHDEEYDEDIPNRADGVRDAIITISSLPSALPNRSLLFRIGEICVDESKGNITAEVAIEKIRALLRAERQEE